MDLTTARKNLAAVAALMNVPTTTKDNIRRLRGLVKGIRPELDEALAGLEREFPTIQKLAQGDIISLVVQDLPETTEEEKKRKKALMLFINTWDKLKSEVARVQSELTAAEGTDRTEQGVHWAKILKSAVGPLGLITAVAVGVGLLQVTAVTIEIKNVGCGTFEASGTPIPLPGLSLPKGSIPSGSSATATLPPLTVSVDGTAGTSLVMKALAFTMTFGLPGNIRDVVINGTSLLNKKSEVRLSEHKTHALILSCR